MLKILQNNEVEVSGEVNGLYFVVYKDAITPLTPSTDIAIIEAVKTIATLTALLREAGAALEPFTHEDLRSLKVGNASGEESIIFARNEADLKIKHFNRAADIKKRIQEVVG